MSAIYDNPAKFKRIDVLSLNSTIGAEIHRVDLSRPLDEDTWREVRQTFYDYLVVYFPNQPLTNEPHMAFSQRFDGMTEAESKPLLGFLYDHCARFENTCHVRWQKDQVLIWDNRCAMHKAIPDYVGRARYMTRTTIAGERPC